MQTTELRSWLRAHWPSIRAELEAGTYRPSAVRRVTIPKPTGGTRELGVPTALDRMVQQALSQVLTPIFDPCFSALNELVLAHQPHHALAVDWISGPTRPEH